MEEMSKEIRTIIDTICGGFYIYKDEEVIGKARKAAGKIQEDCKYFLQGNIFGMEEEGYRELYRYVVHVLGDFVEAAEQEDTVLMLDTLDYGLREIIDIYKENEGAAG